MNLDDRMTIPEAVVARRLGEETVLLNLETRSYFGLDPVGTRVWELLEEGHGLRAVLAKLLEEYDTSGATLQRDILELVEKLRSHGLVRLAGE